MLNVNDYADYNPDYNSNLSSHLPMSFVALHNLGATKQHIKLYLKTTLPKLEKTKPTNVVMTKDNWLEHVGNKAFYKAYLEYFEEILEQKNLNLVMQQYLPIFLKSPASQAYHCILRLAYGVISNNPKEIAAGLAYCAISYAEFYLLDTKPYENMTDFDNGFANIKAKYDHYEFKVPKSPNIGARFANVLLEKNSNDILYETVLPPHVTLKHVALKCLELYLQTRNFTILHCLTSAHALRILNQFLTPSQQREAMVYYWQSINLAYISIGAPEIKAIDDYNFSDIPSVEKVKNIANKSLDDHEIKIAFSMLEEANTYGDERFLQAAL